LAFQHQEVPVAAVSIRELDDSVREKLRVRAARHGRSMEAEMRAILTAAVRDDDVQPGLFAALVDRFAELGGVELDLPPRATPARAADPLE
jgi:plasmid stability protein